MARKTRLNSLATKKIKQTLIEQSIKAHGKIICNHCRKEKKPEELIVDHIDNNYLNDDPKNKQLLCISCNYLKNPPIFFKSKAKPLDSVSVRGWIQLKEKAQFAEMEKNIQCKPRFVEWFYSEMLKQNEMELDDVINSGSFISGVSPDTVYKRYLKPMCSKVALCQIVDNIVQWRKNGRETFLKFHYKEFIKKYSK